MTANNSQTNGINPTEQLFSEAPASWNTRYIDPSGFECQITLRADSGLDLLEKAASAIAYLLKNGCTPYVFRSNGARKDSFTSEAQDAAAGDEKSNGNGNGSNGNPAWCPIHNVEMRRWEKGGRAWFSHKDGDGWCSGRPRRK